MMLKRMAVVLVLLCLIAGGAGTILKNGANEPSEGPDAQETRAGTTRYVSITDLEGSVHRLVHGEY